MRTKTLTLLLLLVMQGGLLKGQDSSICEVHDSSGWAVPKVGEPVVLTARQPVPGSDPRYANVYVKIVRPKRARTLRLTLFKVTKGTLSIQREPVIVKQLQEFTFGEKPYAYAVEFARVGATSGAEAGAVFQVLYLDLNRDGVFDVMRTCGEMFPPPPQSGGWPTHRASKKFNSNQP